MPQVNALNKSWIADHTKSLGHKISADDEKLLKDLVGRADRKSVV